MGIISFKPNSRHKLKMHLHSPFPTTLLIISLFSFISTSPTTVNYTDTSITPIPSSHYIRYLTLLAVGTRTYTCPPANSTSQSYTLQTFDYDMYDTSTDPNLTISLGKHVLLLENDAAGGRSVFYTATKTFTYW